jgi:hypothetical protein
VSIVVKFARKHRIEFVVIGGGHSTSGASATHGGIVISMTRMRKVLTDPASKTVCVQGGATWDDVNQSTAPYKLAVVGATDGKDDVGGSTLGGGYGWLTGQYGLIIDNLLSVKIVLADGEVMDASEDEHKDLFWAIRGAGQAFGVVTELVFKAHEFRNDVFAGFLYFSVDKLPKIVEFANWFDEKQDENSGLFFGFRAPSASDLSVVVTILFYNGPKEKAEAFYGPLLSLHPIINQTRMMSYVELNKIANIEPNPECRKCLSGANIRFPVDVALVDELWGEFERIMHGYPNRGRFYNVGFLLCWHDAGHDPVIQLYQRSIISKIENSHEDQHAENMDAYSNYAGELF